ncbi:hypothetical protein Aau02nite_59160 [Amorphoplanes auranticolor]|uniref:Uncharacterized protein n=1 Tax=Actinoplanes auranticolor TaxID=47988 RepID=A0A919SNA7_9ACTN|nr:hypothetical protein Aau02nite_59160 [Actinoplanes auranticolor]
MRGVPQGGPSQSQPIYVLPWADRPPVAPLHGRNTSDPALVAAIAGATAVTKLDTPRLSGQITYCNLHEKLSSIGGQTITQPVRPAQRSEVHTAADTPQSSPAGVAG